MQLIYVVGQAYKMRNTDNTHNYRILRCLVRNYIFPIFLSQTCRINLHIVLLVLLTAALVNTFHHVTHVRRQRLCMIQISARVSEYQKGSVMALNTLKRLNHLTPLGLKGLNVEL